MRVCLIGEVGMLGHVVDRWLREVGHTVVYPTHRFSIATLREWMTEVMALAPNWFVNCAFTRSDPGGPDALDTNLFLPTILARSVPPNIGVIHAGSDAVFAPANHGCPVDAPPDATDTYGFIKRLTETAFRGANRHVIRCSIIGPDLGRPRNLLSWYLSRPAPVSGYLNHTWNGITTLEWAKICERIISGSFIPAANVVQPGILPPISKYDLLTTVGTVWGHSIPVTPVAAENDVTRFLIPSIECPSLIDQLAELRVWYSAETALAPPFSPPTNRGNENLHPDTNPQSPDVPKGVS